MMLRKSVISCAVAAFLTACGGGGSESSTATTATPSVNQAPVANAGPAQSVLTGCYVRRSPRLTDALATRCS